MSEGSKILKSVQVKWQLMLIVNALFIGGGVSLFTYLLTSELNVSLLLVSGVLGIGLGIFIFKPYRVSIKAVARWIDKILPQAQNSSYLIATEDQLSSISQLQQNRVAKILNEQQSSIPMPVSLKTGLVALVLLAALGWSLNMMIETNRIPLGQPLEVVEFLPVSGKAEIEPLKITDQSVQIDYPNYTRRRTVTSSDMNVTALEGTRLTWDMTFNRAPKQLFIQFLSGRKLPLKMEGNGYSASFILIDNGFYKLVYSDDSVTFESSLYQLKMLIDEPPTVEITDMERFTLIDYDGKKDIKFTSALKDDFGLSNTEIIATVSKGSGESVKFREERFSFDQALQKGSKEQLLSKSLNLDDLKMTPGDELYFYVQAFDNKQPEPNRSRTETYFVSIRDTTEVSFSLEGSLGVDLMPEYFRSQRQIIIDTEKLIKERKKLSEHDFNSGSNELGYDQKALRLKYGQFMGEEFETGITESAVPEGLGEEHDHDHEEGEDHDPLEEYSHKHDSENEHNLVPEEETDEDPLEEYKHAHDDPEEATLYTVSIKGKLRAAMAEMWDAELYLRLYEPEKSLPYQYRALELIKEIKNHARIYVQRIGFDPPPIKEESRLTGDIAPIENLSRMTDEEIKDNFKATLDAIAHIDQLLIKEDLVMNPVVFEQAGQEIAKLAVEFPGKYFQVLQSLQALRVGKVDQNKLKQHLLRLQAHLTAVIPGDQAKVAPQQKNSDKLSNALKEAINASSK